MALLIILLVTEILTLAVLRQHFYSVSLTRYYISLIIHFILSLWTWIIYIELSSYNSFYDNPKHVWLMLNMAAIIVAIVIPRIIIILFHFSGRLIKRKTGVHLRWLTNTGMVMMIVIIIVISISSLYGRFNFKKEEVTIKIEGLSKDLDGLKIVQISDMHLSSFYHHKAQLEKVINEVNMLSPDLLINTGDFISFGWREFEHNDTLFSRARGKYGSYAILGNHDVGTYDPFFTEADRENNILIMNNLIQASGYQVLNDEFKIVKIGKARIGMVGVVTGGRHPHMTHGNLNKALSGLDSVD